MRDFKRALYVSFGDGNEYDIRWEELRLLDNRWIRVSGTWDGKMEERTVDYREAREFALRYIDSNNSSKVPQRIPELEFLLQFDFPIILKVEDFDEPWIFDPTEWTLFAHIKDGNAAPLDFDHYETVEDFVFTASELWLRICVSRASVDCDTYTCINASILDQTHAARLLGINGIDLPDSLKPFEVVKKLTPAMLLQRSPSPQKNLMPIDLENESLLHGNGETGSKATFQAETTVVNEATDRSETSDRTTKSSRESDGEFVHSQLEGQSAQLFRFLLHRMHYVTFDSLRKTFDTEGRIFEVAEPSDETIRTAIRRLNAKLTEHVFTCQIDKNRVRLDYISSP